MPEEYLPFWDALEQRSGYVRHVHRTQGNNPALLRANRQYSAFIQAEGGLGERLNELVILETVRMRRYAYIWHQHVPIALRVGATREEVLALEDWRAGPFTPAERAMLALVDGVAGVGPIAATLTAEAGAHFPPAQVVTIGMLSGFYTMMTRFGEAVDLQTEAPFIGWRLEHLPEA